MEYFLLIGPVSFLLNREVFQNYIWQFKSYSSEELFDC